LTQKAGVIVIGKIIMREQGKNNISKPFYTKWWIYVILVAVLIGGGFGIKSYVNYRHWSAPYYNQTGSHNLLSSKVDKLNDDQETAFYDIAKGAMQTQDKNLNFDNLNDDSLYVEKINKKKTYHIEYVCQSNLFLKIKFRTSLNVTLKKSSLKEDTKFIFYDYKSDLTDLATNSD